MHRIRIEWNISFKSPWHCGSGEGGLHTDRLVRRDSANCPYVPGSTLKGVVRENCEKLSRILLTGIDGYREPTNPHETDFRKHPERFAPLRSLTSPVDALFGNSYEEGGIFFRDAQLDQPHPYRDFMVRSRICRFRALGTVRTGHLFSSEYVMPLTLQTAVDGFHREFLHFESGIPPLAYCLLVAGIMSTDRLGGDKSTGAGRVEATISSVRYNGDEVSVSDIIEYLELYQ